MMMPKMMMVMTKTATTTTTTTTTTTVPPCVIDSASSLLIFPSCLNMKDATLESLLTGNNSQQIIDLLRNHVNNEKVTHLKLDLTAGGSAG